MSQGMQAPVEAGKDKENEFFPRAPEGTSPAHTSILAQ